MSNLLTEILEKDRAEQEERAEDLGNVLGSLDNSRNVELNFVVCLLAELLLIAAVFFASRWISNLDIRMSALLLALMYGIGFVAGLTGYKLLRKQLHRPTSLEQVQNGIMSGFANAQRRGHRWHRWAAAALCGIINLLVLSFLVSAWSG